MRLGAFALALALALTTSACGTNPPAAPDGGTRRDVRVIDGASFGKVCTPGGVDCVPSEICPAAPGSKTGKGFCTKTCTDVGKVEGCLPPPAGTFAACVYPVTVSTGTKISACGFVCAVDDGTGGTQSYPCPGSMSCDPTPSPATSKQRLCIPP